MTKILFDPMKHLHWIPPQSVEWHTNLALESGGYKYPWESTFDEPRAEVIFAKKITAFLGDSAQVLDVGCGHGDLRRCLPTKQEKLWVSTSSTGT